jgi:hypothetical protein
MCTINGDWSVRAGSDLQLLKSQYFSSASARFGQVSVALLCHLVGHRFHNSFDERLRLFRSKFNINESRSLRGSGK